MNSNNNLIREAYEQVQTRVVDTRNWFLKKDRIPASGTTVIKSPRSSVLYGVTFWDGKVKSVRPSAHGAQIEIESVNQLLDSGQTLGDAITAALFYPANYDFGREENDILYGDSQPLPASAPGDTTHNNGSVQ